MGKLRRGGRKPEFKDGKKELRAESLKINHN
jgi:hypothetical protein